MSDPACVCIPMSDGAILRRIERSSILTEAECAAFIDLMVDERSRDMARDAWARRKSAGWNPPRRPILGGEQP